MKKIDNKGFTLVELLAVLVILIAIMSIAIPSISSSLDRSKSKQDDAKKKVLESAAELYVTDYKNKITSSSCYITLQQLLEEGYIDDEAIIDSNDQVFTGFILYTRTTNTYEYKNSGGSLCVS